MQRPAQPVTPSEPTRAPAQDAAQAASPRFQRPTVRRLGTLPAVTTAFGGSFTP